MTSSKRYHINGEGIASLCKATTSDGCPFGGDNEHFLSMTAARIHYEKVNTEFTFMTLKKDLSDCSDDVCSTNYTCVRHAVKKMNDAKLLLSKTTNEKERRAAEAEWEEGLILFAATDYGEKKAGELMRESGILHHRSYYDHVWSEVRRLKEDRERSRNISMLLAANFTVPPREADLLEEKADEPLNAVLVEHGRILDEAVEYESWASGKSPKGNRLSGEILFEASAALSNPDSTEADLIKSIDVIAYYRSSYAHRLTVNGFVKDLEEDFDYKILKTLLDKKVEEAFAHPASSNKVKHEVLTSGLASPEDFFARKDIPKETFAWDHRPAKIQLSMETWQPIINSMSEAPSIAHFVMKYHPEETVKSRAGSELMVVDWQDEVSVSLVSQMFWPQHSKPNDENPVSLDNRILAAKSFLSQIEIMGEENLSRNHRLARFAIKDFFAVHGVMAEESTVKESIAKPESRKKSWWRN